MFPAFKSDLALTAAKPPVSELCISYIEVFCYLMFSDTPINKAPAIGTQDLNLYRLFRLVRNFGGYNKVSLPFDERSTGLPPTIPSTDLPTTTLFFFILLFILVVHSAKGRFSMATSDTSRYNKTFIFAWEEVK